MHILHVVGARPNFMKASPVVRALAAQTGVRQTLVHTGQHYDRNMSEAFFDQLDLSPPDINLNVGSGSHAEQTASVMLHFEKVVLDMSPDLVLVYGDVNSTLAATLVCAKLQVPVGHVEAGLRSADRTMPEEINRLATDCLADLLFTPSADADANLRREGVSAEKIHLVGNVMIDTLVRLLPQAELSTILAQLGLTDGQRRPEPYILVTLHRPSNVDAPDRLRRLLDALHEIGSDLPVIFPVHPRTAARIDALGLTIQKDRVRITEPLAYLEFLCLQTHATAVVTDSGGIQEETTYLGVPCLTMRDTTERPITVELGTNQLLGGRAEKLPDAVKAIVHGKAKRGQIPPLWDGRAAERIALITLQWWQRQHAVPTNSGE